MSTKAKAKSVAKAKPKPPADPVAIPPGAPVLLSQEQVAACLGIGDRSVGKMRSAGRFPEPDLFVLGMPRWKPGTVAAWIDAQPKESTSARRVPTERP